MHIHAHGRYGLPHHPSSVRSCQTWLFFFRHLVINYLTIGTQFCSPRTSVPYCSQKKKKKNKLTLKHNVVRAVPLAKIRNASCIFLSLNVLYVFSFFLFLAIFFFNQYAYMIYSDYTLCWLLLYM